MTGRLTSHYRNIFLVSLLLGGISPLLAQTPPNFIFIVADDFGVDAMNGYHPGTVPRTTPTLDSLMSAGITFENVWATPICTPTRSTVMSGKFGVKTGALGVPGHLDTSNVSVFRELAARSSNQYADAVIGKWHISSPTDPQHPAQHGLDQYDGFLNGAVSDSFVWNRTENGVTVVDSTYITTALTDAAISWVNGQTQPWFLWLAHAAPHSPFHEPPADLFSVSPTGNDFRKYIAMVEALDHETNRLFNAISDSVLNNTVVIFIGDNGTPQTILRDYPVGHGKGTLYQGGVRVPMIISGAGVTRQGEREPALIQVTDLYATIIELAGHNLPGGLYNSLSFDHLLTGSPGATRDYNYTDVSDGVSASNYTIRTPQYKLIDYTDGTQEFFDLINDSLEFNELITSTGLTPAQQAIKADLEAEALQIRTDWSCRDHIRNGDEDDIDCGGSFCAPCVVNSVNELSEQQAVQIYPNPTTGSVRVVSSQGLITEIGVMNAVGQTVIQQAVPPQQEVNLDLSSAEPQVYLLKITTTKGIRFSRLSKL